MSLSAGFTNNNKSLIYLFCSYPRCIIRPGLKTVLVCKQRPYRSIDWPRRSVNVYNPRARTGVYEKETYFLYSCNPQPLQQRATRKPTDTLTY